MIMIIHSYCFCCFFSFFFFFNDTATTEIYTLSLHDALPISGGVSAPSFAELRADAKSGIERGQRALENDADFAAAEGAHLRFGFRGEVFPFEKEIAARCSAFQVKQAMNGERESALAGAALSDEAEDFAGLDLERDVAEDSGLVAVTNGQ